MNFCFKVLVFITIPRAAAGKMIWSLLWLQNMFCLESSTANPLTKSSYKCLAVGWFWAGGAEI